jgi:hemerythrin
MRPLRWKSRFQAGDIATDRQKRAFFDCLNSLITAAGHREHCQEMEDFLGAEPDPGGTGPAATRTQP